MGVRCDGGRMLTSLGLNRYTRALAPVERLTNGGEDRRTSASRLGPYAQPASADRMGRLPGSGPLIVEGRGTRRTISSLILSRCWTQHLLIDLFTPLPRVMMLCHAYAAQLLRSKRADAVQMMQRSSHHLCSIYGGVLLTPDPKYLRKSRSGLIFSRSQREFTPSSVPPFVGTESAL